MGNLWGQPVVSLREMILGGSVGPIIHLRPQARLTKVVVERGRGDAKGRHNGGPDHRIPLEISIARPPWTILGYNVAACFEQISRGNSYGRDVDRSAGESYGCVEGKAQFCGIGPKPTSGGGSGSCHFKGGKWVLDLRSAS